MTMEAFRMLAVLATLCCYISSFQAKAFVVSSQKSVSTAHLMKSPVLLSASNNEVSSSSSVSNQRRNVLQQSSLLLSGLVFGKAPSALAVEKKSLEDCIYTILRVREATQQETRLITTGKFKDMQRANVKLAIKFMITNYRLSDAFITAASYIGDNSRRVEAGDVGQSAVQNLYTILEYFDAADVQNIKIGKDSMSGKEELVLKGLDSTRRSIDSFLSYFPSEKVNVALTKIKDENELNRKEYDPSLGDIVNLAPQKS